MAFITSQVRKLKIAIILKALEDARAGEEEAIEWLQTVGAEWADQLGVLSQDRFRMGIKEIIEQPNQAPARGYRPPKLRKTGTSN